MLFLLLGLLVSIFNLANMIYYLSNYYMGLSSIFRRKYVFGILLYLMSFWIGNLFVKSRRRPVMNIVEVIMAWVYKLCLCINVYIEIWNFMGVLMHELEWCLSVYLNAWSYNDILRTVKHGCNEDVNDMINAFNKKFRRLRIWFHTRSLNNAIEQSTVP